MTFCPFSGIWEKQKNSHMCCFSFPFAGQLHKHRQFGIFHEQLYIDEGMVPYFGHHSCKMFIRGKPIRFGYKIWTMSSANGIPVNDCKSHFDYRQLNLMQKQWECMLVKIAPHK
ncbi:PiggyBac transposable element-derived protein 3 [Trichinella nelsoni]|uniref:PiggyBac transposable element-derived protein 3 n=1 Tax=Trichinella nelsoni TaxID=6336 RepID=A0A0V0S0P9_9BILA|nr:PiggyBac transposable element-derived protein 3 [Trichinella nelsoni]